MLDRRKGRTPGVGKGCDHRDSSMSFFPWLLLTVTAVPLLLGDKLVLLFQEGIFILHKREDVCHR